MPGYMQTEVGVIPDDWEACQVFRKGEVLGGKALDVNGHGELRPYLRTKNVFDGKIVIDDVLKMPMTDAQFSQFQVKAGDVLLNEGQSLELVGRCSLYQDEYPEPCAMQNALLRFRAYEGVSSRFAAHLFRYCQAQGVFARIALQTTSIAHLGSSRFERLCLAWPKLEEQNAIAFALSDVDTLISSLDQLITKKRDIQQAAIQQLLTGERRLPGFSGPWDVKPMRALGNTYGGLAGKTKKDFGHGEARYIPFMNVMTDTVIDASWLEPVDVAPDEAQSLAKKGDLFFNGSSETPEEVGFCSVLLEEIPNLYLNSFCFGFRFNAAEKVSGLFFAYWFRSKAGRAAMSVLAQGATRYNIAKSAFMKLEIPQPSEEEQTAIATVLSDMDAELAALNARRNKARQLKQGMMQELLTGRIRLA